MESITELAFPRLCVRIEKVYHIPFSEISYSPITCAVTLNPISLTKRFMSTLTSHDTFNGEVLEFPITNIEGLSITISLEHEPSIEFCALTLPLSIFPKFHYAKSLYTTKAIGVEKSPLICLSVHLAHATQGAFEAHRGHLKIQEFQKEQPNVDVTAVLADLACMVLPRSLLHLVCQEDPNKCGNENDVDFDRPTIVEPNCEISGFPVPDYEGLEDEQNTELEKNTEDDFIFNGDVQPTPQDDFFPPPPPPPTNEIHLRKITIPKEAYQTRFTISHSTHAKKAKQ